MAQAPRLRDVAERAGVSVALVSSYINRPDQVSRKSAARIEQAINELRFVPNDAARRLRRGVSQMVAFVAFDVSDPLFAAVARGAQARASEVGLRLVLADTGGLVAAERDYISLFEEQRVRGILLAPSGDPAEYLQSLSLRGIPAVLVDQPASDPRSPSVSVNDRLGGELAARHLLEIGKREIAVVGGRDDLRQIRDRRRGARDAVATERDASLRIIDTDARDVGAGRAAAEELLRLATPPDAMFCINDLVASGALQTLARAGTRVPEEIAVIGYNDTAADTSATISLSSIRQPHEEFGRAALDVLLAEFDRGEDGPRPHLVLDPVLVVRESTAGSKVDGRAAG